jgi:hypothetical protein
MPILSGGNLDISSFENQTSDEMDLLDQAALLHIAILQEEMLLQQEEDEIMAMEEEDLKDFGLELGSHTTEGSSLATMIG